MLNGVRPQDCGNLITITGVLYFTPSFLSLTMEMIVLGNHLEACGNIVIHEYVGVTAE